MCRYKIEEGEQKVYGVLMDFDLSSWKKDLEGDYTMTSQQRTGTPPYMAQELLLGASRTHLYRHDLESLFYVMLLTATRHSIGIPEGKTHCRLVMREERGKKIQFDKLPFYDWFDQCNYKILGSLKVSFLLCKQPINLSPDFKDFKVWLERLQSCFTNGFSSRSLAREKPPPADVFDEETLGGYITYDAVVTQGSRSTGELEGLLVRDPEIGRPEVGHPKTRQPKTRQPKPRRPKTRHPKPRHPKHPPVS